MIEGLCGALAARGAKDRSAAPLIVLAWARLRRLSVRFALLAAAVRDGRLAAASAARRRADPPPALPPRGMPPASPAEAWPAPPRLPALPPPHRLPRGFGWLLRLAPEAAAYGGQVEHLLADPEMAALLAAAPQAGRILRPLCRMLAIRPGPALRAARREPPASSAAPAGSGRPAVSGGLPPDAASSFPERPRPTRVRSPIGAGADPPLALPAPA
jgi:hypothetical protein